MRRELNKRLSRLNAHCTSGMEDGAGEKNCGKEKEENPIITTPHKVITAAMIGGSEASCSGCFAKSDRSIPDTSQNRDLLNIALCEKEEDLELVAKIGHSLLEQNRELQERNQFLEEALTTSNETIAQLSHQMRQRASLYNAWLSADEANSEGAPKSPKQEERVGHTQVAEERLQWLERENQLLKAETSRLEDYMLELEQRDMGRMAEYAHQLEEANSKLSMKTPISHLQKQIDERNHECGVQQENLEHLLQEIALRKDAEKNLEATNEDLHSQLREAVHLQAEIRAELELCQERYLDVLTVLHETEDELSGHRLHSVAMAIPPQWSASSDSLYYSSLASELEASDSGCYNTPMFSARYGADAIAEELPHERLSEEIERLEVGCVEEGANEEKGEENEGAEAQKQPFDLPTQALKNAIREGSSPRRRCFTGSEEETKIGLIVEATLSLRDEEGRARSTEGRLTKSREAICPYSPAEELAKPIAIPDTPMSHSTISFQSTVSRSTVKTIIPASSRSVDGWERVEGRTVAKVPNGRMDRLASGASSVLYSSVAGESSTTLRSGSVKSTLCSSGSNVPPSSSLWGLYSPASWLRGSTYAGGLLGIQRPTILPSQCGNAEKAQQQEEESQSSGSSPRESANSTASTSSTSKLLSRSTESLNSYSGPKMGEPGQPGTRDLDWGIRRLRLKRRLNKEYEEFRRRSHLRSAVKEPCGVHAVTFSPPVQAASLPPQVHPRRPIPTLLAPSSLCPNSTIIGTLRLSESIFRRPLLLHSPFPLWAGWHYRLPPHLAKEEPSSSEDKHSWGNAINMSEMAAVQNGGMAWKKKEAEEPCGFALDPLDEGSLTPTTTDDETEKMDRGRTIIPKMAINAEIERFTSKDSVSLSQSIGALGILSHSLAPSSGIVERSRLQN